MVGVRLASNLGRLAYQRQARLSCLAPLLRTSVGGHKLIVRSKYTFPKIPPEEDKLIVKSPYSDVEIPECNLADHVWKDVEKWPENIALVSLQLYCIKNAFVGKKISRKKCAVFIIVGLRNDGKAVHVRNGLQHVQKVRLCPPKERCQKRRRSGDGRTKHSRVPHRFSGRCRRGDHPDHHEPDIQARSVKKELSLLHFVF